MDRSIMYAFNWVFYLWCVSLNSTTSSILDSGIYTVIEMGTLQTPISMGQLSKIKPADSNPTIIQNNMRFYKRRANKGLGIILGSPCGCFIMFLSCIYDRRISLFLCNTIMVRILNPISQSYLDIERTQIWKSIKNILLECTLLYNQLLFMVSSPHWHDLHFRWLNIKGFNAEYPTTITLFFNHLNWNWSEHYQVKKIWL